jgi:hypothetical protein
MRLFEYELGREAEARALPTARDHFASILVGSELAPRAQLELARLAFRSGHHDAGIAAAANAARVPSLARAVVRELALARESTTLQTLPDSPYAEAARSRIDLGLADAPVDAFDASALAVVCLGGGGSDGADRMSRAATRAVPAIDRLLAVEDDTDLFTAVVKLGPPTDTTAALVRIALSLDGDTRELLTWQAETTRELTAFRALTRELQESQLGGDALQNIVLEQAIARAELGHAFRQRLPDLRADLLVLTRRLAERGAPLPISYGRRWDHALYLPVAACTDAYASAALVDSTVPLHPASPPTGCAGCQSTDDARGWLLVLLAVTSAAAGSRARRPTGRR